MRFRKFGPISMGLAVAGWGALAPSPAYSCSVCISPLLDARVIEAYYTTGILLTFAALTLIGGFYFLIIRKYMKADREQDGTTGLNSMISDLDASRSDPSFTHPSHLTQVPPLNTGR